MLSIIRTCLFYLLFIAGSAFAGDGDWHVSRSSQQVAYTLDKQKWAPVKAGDTIPNNAWISTGPRGRVQLVRGVESISFQPNTLAGIFTRETSERKTNIYQQVGILDLEIEKRSRPHTSVQTPYLAAVVKGTNFQVSVDGRQAKVAVNRGLVQVTSFSSGQRSEVGARQSATVDGGKGMSVSGATSPPTIEKVAPSAAQVAPIDARMENQPDAPATSINRQRMGWASKPSTAAETAKDSEETKDGTQRRNGWSVNNSFTSSNRSYGLFGGNKANSETYDARTTKSSNDLEKSNKKNNGLSSSKSQSSPKASGGFGNSTSNSSSNTSNGKSSSASPSKSERGSVSSGHNSGSSSSKSSGSGNGSSSGNSSNNGASSSNSSAGSSSSGSGSSAGHSSGNSSSGGGSSGNSSSGRGNNR